MEATLTTTTSSQLQVGPVDSPDMRQGTRAMRPNVLQLQTLVSVVLAYQLLFSPAAKLTRDAEFLVVFGLMLLGGVLMVVPARFLATEWFPGTLATVDTAITAALMYISSMADAEKALKTRGQLKTMGVQISIDDFGTGYSSLIYLRRFRIDTLKIDRAFTQDMTDSTDAQAIVAAIIAMAKALKLKVIAEGIEKSDQMELLEQYGCYEGQRYAFSRPLPAEEMTVLLRRLPSRS
jgi:hypothetical protein